MAERVISVGLKVNTDDSKQSVDSLNQSLQKTDETLEQIEQQTQSMTMEDKLAEINREVKSGELNFRQLRKKLQDYQSIAVAAGRTSPIGQKALQEAAVLRDQLDGLDQEVKMLSHDALGMKAALQLGQGVIGGFSAFRGIAAAVGVENENLMKVMTQLQGLQAASMGIEQLHNLTRKESALAIKAQAIATSALSAAQRTYAVVVGASTGAMKLFRIALASTGIGLLIVGLGLLITNFQSVIEWVGGVIDWFAKLGTWFVRLAEFLGFVESGTADAMEAQRKAHEQQIKQEKELARAHQERMKQIEEQKKAKISAANSAIEGYNKEIELLEAQGKSTDELTLKVMQAELIKQQAVLEANQQKIESAIQYYTDLAALRGQDEEEFKKSMLAQGIDLEDLHKRSIELVEENEHTIKVSEARIEKFKKDARRRDFEDSKKNNVKWLEAEKLKYNEALKTWEEYTGDLKDIAIEEDLSFDDILDPDDLEIQMEKTLGKFREFTNKVGEVIKTGNETVKEDVSATMQHIQQGLNQALEIFGAVNGLLDQLNENRIHDNEDRRDQELANLEKEKQSELKQENLSAEERKKIEQDFAQTEFEIKKKTAEENDKINERAFNRNKAFKLAEASIDVLSGIAKALGSSPPPLNFINAGVVGVVGGLNIAKIAATRYRSSNTNISPPSFDVSGGSGGGATSQGTTTGSGQNNTTTDVEALLNGQNGGSTKVVLSQVELNEANSELVQMEQVSKI